ncbi:hypothetical protein ACIXCW_01935 [Bacteroides fragilis]
MIALPTKDNPRYDKILKSLDRHQTDEHRKDFSLRQKKAIAILEAQQKKWCWTLYRPRPKILFRRI